MHNESAHCEANFDLEGRLFTRFPVFAIIPLEKNLTNNLKWLLIYYILVSLGDCDS